MFHGTNTCCIFVHFTLSILNVIHKEIQKLKFKSVHSCQTWVQHEIYRHVILFTQKN